MATKLDISCNSVVILCTDCPWWRGFRLSIDAAHDCAVDHQSAVHPGDTQATKARHTLHATRAKRLRHAAL